MGYRIIINIRSSSICYLFFINSITRRKTNFKRCRKRWLFNICFLIDRGSIQIKEGSSNMNCMRNLFIIINFIKEFIGQEILRERIRGNVGFAPCFIFNFMQTKRFVQILPNLKWILSRIYEMIYISIHSQKNNSIISITIINPIFSS